MGTLQPRDDAPRSGGLRVIGVEGRVRSTCLVTVPDLNFSVGKLHLVIGPNGAGKSSLLRCIAGTLSHQGQVVVRGQDISGMPAHARAKVLAYQPQVHGNAEGMTAWDFVMAARGAELHWLKGPGQDDRERARVALEQVGAESLAPRFLGSLSGGERARVVLAATLARGRPWLLLDEPAAAADIAAARFIYGLLRALVEREGIGIVAVEHDLSLARSWADTVTIMDQGGVAFSGEVAQAFAGGVIERVYGARFECFCAGPRSYAVAALDGGTR